MNKITYYENIDDIVNEITIPCHTVEDKLGSFTIIVDDIDEHSEKSLRKWIVSYCEGMIEGTKDRKDIFVSEEKEDCYCSCNINDVGIKWFEITDDDKYKITFEYKPIIIHMNDDKICGEINCF